MSASKRTSIRLENAITISPFANNDDMLCCAFACYSVNPAIRRTCKTLDAYFAMPKTIDDLAAQGALGAYGQWEYRALRFDADRFFPAGYPITCDACGTLQHQMGNLPEWVKHDWPVPSAMPGCPPTSSPRLLHLFKHLVNSRGLYYFFHRDNLNRGGKCRCNGPYPHELANKYCMGLQMLFDYSLCGTISTQVPSCGIKLRYSFRITYQSFTFCEIQTTAQVEPDGSPQSIGLSGYTYQAFDMPFDINERPLHQHNWKLLEMPSEARPAFATDTMLGYIAFMILRRMSRRITLNYSGMVNDLINLEFGFEQMKEYINNAKLGPYEYDNANVSTSGLYKSNYKRAYV